MRRSWRPAAGIACGVLLWTALIGIWPARSTNSSVFTGQVMSECDGRLQTLIMQYVADARFVDETYRQFLTQLPADIIVYIACPDQATYDLFLGRIGKVNCTLRPAITGHAMTTWSRDRWVGLKGAGRTIMLAPRGELGSEGWEARAGDGRMALTLAGIYPNLATAQASPLFFDGGDILADSQTAFITPAVVRRNLQHTVTTTQELVEQLTRVLQKRIVLLDGAPDHHAGMFMMATGPGQMLVGDPSLARAAWETKGQWPEAPTWHPDFSQATQTRFDTVAHQLEHEGYRVTRIPAIPGENGKAYITYTNVVIDQREGQHIVYLPTYEGLEALNDAAAQTWQSLGYRVAPVDCTSVFQYGGTLHCLVNVVEKRTLH